MGQRQALRKAHEAQPVGGATETGDRRVAGDFHEQRSRRAQVAGGGGGDRNLVRRDQRVPVGPNPALIDDEGIGRGDEGPEAIERRIESPRAIQARGDLVGIAAPCPGRRAAGEISIAIAGRRGRIVDELPLEIKIGDGVDLRQRLIMGDAHLRLTGDEFGQLKARRVIGHREIPSWAARAPARTSVDTR